MKRAAALFLVFALLWAFTACDAQDPDKISVVCTSFPAYDTVRQLAGDKAEYTMLLSPGKDDHSYEPTVKDILSIKKCDIFVYVGGEGDEWAKELLESSGNESMITVSMMEQVPLICAEDENHEDGHGHAHEYDEHVWTSPENMKLISKAVAEALSEKDPENKSFYAEAQLRYEAQLELLSQDIRKTVENGKRDYIVIADRFPLIYFAKEYSLSYYAAFPGCNEKTEPSPAVTAQLIEKVETEKLPAIFKLELSDGYVARAISEKTGAQILTFYACHNVSKADLQSGETYISLMRRNIEALAVALN